MNSYELKTHEERIKFKKENIQIGYHSDEYCNIDNIWFCELYKNKATEKHSILIVKKDKSWVIFDFE